MVGWDVDPVVAEWRSRPRLETIERADLCVVGLGGSGLAAIGEAIRRGLSVVGLDAGRVAAGAAGRNGGFLLGGPALAIHQAEVAWGRSEALALYRQTLEEITALADLLGPEVVRRVGSIRLAGLPAASVDEDEVDEHAEWLDCLEQKRALTQAGIAVREYHGALGRGLLLPDDAAVNPARRALGLAALYAGSARLYENSPVVSVRPGGVDTEAGSVRADLVLVAVDGRLEELLPELKGLVRTARLQMLATDPLPGAVRRRVPRPVYARWGYDYAQCDPSGRLFVGGGRDRFEASEWTTATEPSEPVQRWIEAVAGRFAGQAVAVSHRWGASVGFTPDARPLIGFVRPGVLACGGYNGTGNLVGPIAARAALALALDGRMPSPVFHHLG